jgi:Domain of unknown function (DUF4249)
MKKIAAIFFITVIMLINYSCEENFSPKGNFQQKYILNCIIRGDTSLQTATISKSYNVNGYDPYANTNDPFLANAYIRIWVGDNVYFMKDSSITRTDSSRYNTPLHFFYCDNFQAGINKDLEIQAILPDGKTLEAQTTIPDPVQWNFTNVDTSDTNAFRIPSLGNDYFSFNWYQGSSNGWYLPRFVVIYAKVVNGVEERHEITVPERYENIGGNIEPVYPSPNRNVSSSFQNNALDSIFNQISAGDPDKSHYKIYGGIFELLVFDDNLSKYYSSTNGFLDDYTVRLDENDFTNINGGLGIFGSYLFEKRGALIATEYITSFGYIPANP